MNSRHLLPPESLCNPSRTGSPSANSAAAAAEEEDQMASARTRSSRALPNSFLIRMAMRISRARWFTFLRRVFHYQNGSRSDLGSNPFNSSTWMMLEFIALMVQITITTFTLAISQREKPVWPMRVWISGYDIGCVLNLLLLYGRYRRLYLTQGDALSLSDLEGQRGYEETRAPKLNVLCISLLAWNAITYSFPFLLFLLLCCCVPLLSSLLGYNINVASTDRGASDDQISQLPSWRYKEVHSKFELRNHSEATEGLINEDPECCICLAQYKDKEEVRQLPCSHMFHLKCVDQWLRIISCCPLCKQGLQS